MLENGIQENGRAMEESHCTVYTRMKIKVQCKAISYLSINAHFHQFLI